jgi:hypothetical protein
VISLFDWLLTCSLCYCRVQWAAQERELVEQYTARCLHRTYHSKSFQTVHGCSPVTFAPRVVMMHYTSGGTAVYTVELCNESRTNAVKFSVATSEHRAGGVCGTVGTDAAANCDGDGIDSHAASNVSVAEKSVFPSWLSVTPSSGFLLPGQTITLVLERNGQNIENR